MAGIVPATPIAWHGRAPLIGVAGTSPAMTNHKGSARRYGRGRRRRIELLSEQRNRPGVDLRLVPLEDRVEIRRALVPVLAALPALVLEIVRRRGEDIGRAVDQVALAVAVEVDGVIETGRRQKLGLSDLSGPQALELGGGLNAARGDA